VELVALTLHHPASDRETKDQAERLLAELTAELPAQMITTAQERGEGRTFEQTVEMVLREGLRPPAVAA
jgi:hypothetical protein